MRSEAGCAKPRLPLLESLPSFCTGCGSKAPNSTGHQRRLLISLHSRTTGFPPTSGTQRPCRDAGVGAIALGLAMLKRAKRASHIDPPASSFAIMRRARPYRGENPAPGKDVHGELDPTPGIRERPRPKADIKVQARPDIRYWCAIYFRRFLFRRRQMEAVYPARALPSLAKPFFSQKAKNWSGSRKICSITAPRLRMPSI